METNKEKQKIVEEYLKEQETSKLKLCIYEERESEDREWFYDGENWCYLEKVFIKDEYAEEKGAEVEVYRLKKKRIKTFSKNCSVQSLSFEYFMALKAMEYYKEEEPYVSDVENYTKKYLNNKKENPDITVEEFNEILKSEKTEALKKTGKQTLGCFMWCFTFLFLLCFIGTQNSIVLILTIACCPITYTIIDKIRTKKKE